MKRFLLLFIPFIFSILSTFSQTPDANGRLYVKKGSSGTGDSWSNAIGELSTALYYAHNLGSVVKEVWVAGGNYAPGYSSDWTNTDAHYFAFRLLANLNIYGGFAGNETSLAARDLTITANASVLNGNINGTYAYHVVVGIGNLGAPVLDGFTITNGKAEDGNALIVDNIYVFNFYGGGIFLNNNCAPVLNNLIISGNTSMAFGGGIFSLYNDPAVQYKLSNSTLIGNSAVSGGGGMVNNNSSPTITNVKFLNNSAGSGGAVYTYNSTTQIERSSFRGNVATTTGAVLDSYGSNRITLKGCEVIGNSAPDYSLSAVDLYVVNTTIAGNNTSSGAAWSSGSTTIYNSVIYGNKAGVNGTYTAYNSLIQGVGANTANSIIDGSTDPKFSSPMAYSAAPFTGGDYTLVAGSPLINAGKNSYYTGLSATTTDLNNNPRAYKYTDGGTIDIGGYEYQSGISQTITASDISKTYGNVDFDPGASASSGLAVSYASSDNSIAEVANGMISIKKAGTVTITVSQAGNAIYNAAADVTFTLTIAKTSLIVSANTTSKVYDGVTYSGGNGVVFIGFVYTDGASQLGGTLTYSGTSQGATNVATYTITPGGYTSDNYVFTYLDGNLSITRAGLIATAVDDSKNYDGVGYTGGNGVSYSGFVNGEDAGVVSGTVGYSGSAQGAIDPGSYVITPSGLSAANYTITYADGELEIGKASLTVTAIDDTKSYDGVAYTGGNGVSYSGFVNGETAAVLSGTVGYSGTSQGAVDAGNYVITPSGLSAANYTITYANGVLGINKAALTITANSDNKSYDGNAYSGGNGVTYIGFVNNEHSTALTGTIAYSGSSQGAINANTYSITPSGLSALNYDITYADGALIIAKMPLTITANDDNKIYNGLYYSGGNGFTCTGFVNNETAAVLTGTVTYIGNSQGALDVGNYTITPSGIVAQNYTITYSDGTLSVTKAPLTITANDDSKTYDADAYTGGNGVTYNGLVNGETATVVTGTLTYTGTSQGAINAGAYTITPDGLSAVNYDITYDNGSLTIDKAPLTITATNDSKTYSGVGYTGGNGLIYTGFAGTDRASVLTGPVLYGGNSQGAINVGTYTIIPSGRTSQNYTITYVNGTLTISTTPLTITAVDDAKTYDGNAYSGGNGVSYTGLVNGETAAVLTGSISYSGTSQGATAVGAYVITPSGQTAANYSITYANGALSILKGILTVTANDDSKTYDGTAYTGGNGVTYAGFINGENESVLTGTISYMGTSQGATPAGTYVITPSGFSADNYAIQYTDGQLAINKTALTITADDAARCYNTADPAFTVSYTGFVNNESSAVLTTLPVVGTSAVTASAAGGYDLIPAGAVADNYSLSYVNGTLTIYALPVVTIATPDGAVLCGDNSTVTLTATGANTYAWSAGQTGDAISVSDIGDYSLTATDANGCTAPAENTVTITAATLPVPAFSYNTYCANTPVTFTNTGNGDAFSWYTSDGQSSTENSPAITFSQAGTYTVTLTATIAACPNHPVSVEQEIAIESAVANTRLTDVRTAAGVPVQLNARELTGAVYQWSPSNGLSVADTYNPAVTLTQSQRYYINMSFVSGCTTTDTLLVDISDMKTFVVANAFTPNNDGLNDVLHIGLRGVASLEYFEIYDRWGNRVFRTTAAGDGWKGSVLGKNSAAGAYLWVAQGRDYDGQIVKGSGTVILIR